MDRAPVEAAFIASLATPIREMALFSFLGLFLDVKVELISGRPLAPASRTLGHGRAAPDLRHGGRPVPFPRMYCPRRFHLRLLSLRSQALLLAQLLLPAPLYSAAVRFYLHQLVLRANGGFWDNSLPFPVPAGCLVLSLPGPGPAGLL